MTRTWVLIMLMLWFVTPASAHKVIISVYSGGTMIEGEIGFSNGDMAKGTAVDVFDGDGNKIGETKTDDDGFFIFEPTASVDHIFRANMGAGHVAEIIMPANELPTNLVSGTGGQVQASPVNNKSEQQAVQPLEQQALLADLIRQEIKPLRKEIAAYKEKNDFQSILGGIGYIIGLVGIWFYVAARRTAREKD